MYNFFVDSQKKQGDCYYITDSDHNHIKNVLRMSVGDTVLVSDGNGSDLCRIEEINESAVVAKIIEENFQNTELPCSIYLFQGLPKGDKMELIIQKAVELGVCGIIPTEMNRCVVKLDDKKKKAKTARWQAISESAAKQSKRNTIPEVFEVMSFKNVLQKAKELDLLLVPYENERGMKATKDALQKIKTGMSIGILVGPEGGFDKNEIIMACEAGGEVISLGKRILRTETAAITCAAMCMLHIEMNVDGE